VSLLSLYPELVIDIPGEPVAQGRGKAFMRPGMSAPRIYDPAKSRSWKGAAQVHYQTALERERRPVPAFPAGVAVELHVRAVFTCPKSHHRKVPVERRPKAYGQDGDNIAKAVQDAGNGILWADDSQVVRLVVEKWVGAQYEAPRVEITVRTWP
jgi:Holliday junction resolvase RusA-like endonuclease